jgi:iron complex outermembrane receptor protein
MATTPTVTSVRQIKSGRAWRKSVLLSASALAIAASLPACALAQEEDGEVRLEEIIVTAQKRAQRLQDVPVSVTAVPADTLVANRITTVADLGYAVPNLQVRTVVGGSSLPSYTIRGLFTLGSSPGSDKGVALYIDGVYLGAFGGSIFELAEIERVEVLRGPQGTLFGRNATGGAISFVTKEPPGEFGLKQTLTAGNRDHFRSSTRLNTPQWGPFSASVTYTHSERRGDIRNLGAGTVWDVSAAYGRPKTFTSPKYLGSENLEAVAAAVKFEPSDNFKAVYRYDYSEKDFTANGLGTIYAAPFIRALIASQPNQSILGGISPKRPKAVNANGVVPSRTKAWGHNLTIEYAVSDAVTVKNILAYRWTEDLPPFQDISSIGGLINTGSAAWQTLGFLPFFAGGSAVVNSTIGAPFIIRPTASGGSDEQWSDELQVNVDTDFVTLTAGGLSYYTKLNRAQAGEENGVGRIHSALFNVFPNYQVPFLRQPTTGGGRRTVIKMLSYAAYAYGEFHVTPQLDLVAGVRYTKDRKKGTDAASYTAAAAIVLPVDYRENKVTYNLGVNYKVNDDILVYGKYSTGYISGGSLAGIEYVPETAKSWEAGLKADWFGRTLRTNLAVFDVKYGNLQIPTSGTNLTPPRPEVGQALINAGDAKARGFELEMTYAPPIRGVTLTAALGYTDFKFTKLLPIALIGGVDYLPSHRPDWTANLSAQYRTEPLFGEMFMNARLDASYRSQAWGITQLPTTSALFPAAEQTRYKSVGKLNPYWVLNGRLALEGFKIGGADATVALWGRNLLDEDSPNMMQALAFFSIAAHYEPARTIGVDLTVEF